MVRLFACISLLFFLIPVTYIHDPEPPKNLSQYISLIPLPLNAEDESQTRVGQLDFLGGWQLESENDYFGGFSAMTMQADNRIILLSDFGILAGFNLQDNKYARRPFIALLPSGPAAPKGQRKLNWDAESLITDEESGKYWVAFEHGRAIWRYGRSFARAESKAKVKAMQNWPQNGGPEAMLRLQDGRILIFSEDHPFGAKDAHPGTYEALIFLGDPAVSGTPYTKFGYRPPKGFKLTDATLLPDGRALMLHRRFAPLEGVSAIISTANVADFGSGKIVESTPLATLAPPLTVDNMEAIAAEEKQGRTIIWIASDDNYNPVQENILMKFALVSDAIQASETPPNGQEADTDTLPKKDQAKPGFSILGKKIDAP